MTEVNKEFVVNGIAESLEIDINQVSITSKSSDFEQWDSLGHISIMSFLDKNFNEITERVPDFASATSVLEIIVLLEKFG
jgi:acyl carrier protein